MAPVSGDDRPAVLGGVADEGDHDDRDEKLRETEPLPEAPSEPTRTFETKAVATARDRQGADRPAQAPGAFGGPRRGADPRSRRL